MLVFSMRVPCLTQVLSGRQPALQSGTKIQPKEEVFGRISLRTSGQKLRSGPPNPGKQAFWNGHPARTSMKKLRSEKLRADFFVPYIRKIRPRSSMADLGGGGGQVGVKRLSGFSGTPFSWQRSPENPCLAAQYFYGIREGRKVGDWSLLTSWALISWVPSRPKLLQKKLFTKKMFWCN